MPRTFSTFLLLVCAALCSTAAPALAGTFDSTFGNHGVVTTRIGDGRSPGGNSGDDKVMDLDVLADGRILASGYSPDGYTLARYRRNGTLDPSFGGGDGVVADNPGECPADDQFCFRGGVNAADLQTDGKIVVGGLLAPIRRLNANGTWDESFGEYGGAAISPSGINDLVVQPDNKIVGVGYSASGSQTFGSVVFRLTADGKRDPSFSGDGYLKLLRDEYESLTSVTVQRDGKIVVTGVRNRNRQARGVPRQVLFVARLNRDGSLDRSFGPGRNGWVVFRRESHGWDVKVQPNGLIVVSGDLDFSQSIVARFRPNGHLDRRFGGGDGVAQIPASWGTFFELVVRRGSVVVGGNRGRSAITLVRLTPRGRAGSTLRQIGPRREASRYPIQFRGACALRPEQAARRWPVGAKPRSALSGRTPQQPARTVSQVQPRPDLGVLVRSSPSLAILI